MTSFRVYLPFSALFVLFGCGSENKIDRVNDAPDVDITTPLFDAVLHHGEEGLLQAVVDDDYDVPGDITVTWSLDGGSATPLTTDADGNVSTPFDLDILELGAHQIEVSATDLDEATGSATVDFTIAGPLDPPIVVITAPDDGHTVAIGTSITFTGEANDSSSPIDDLAFAWSSSVDGSLPGAISGGGQSALLTDALSPGTHLITLTVTDTDGDVGIDTITVNVTDEPTEPEPGELIFTEVMVDPDGVEDHFGEYVELYNTSGRTLDLAGYSFHDDGADFWVFDSSVPVAPHSYVVICANADFTTNGGVPCDTWFYRNPSGTEPPAGQGHGDGVAIANNDDELELTSPSGVDIDVFDYNDTNSDAIIGGASFGLDPNMLDGVSNDDPAHWCVQTSVPRAMTDAGTPGTENDSCDGM